MLLRVITCDAVAILVYTYACVVRLQLPFYTETDIFTVLLKYTVCLSPSTLSSHTPCGIVPTLGKDETPSGQDQNSREDVAGTQPLT